MIQREEDLSASLFPSLAKYLLPIMQLQGGTINLLTHIFIHSLADEYSRSDKLLNSVCPPLL